MSAVNSRLKTIWADAAYRGQELADWCKAQGDWDLDVVEWALGVRGFAGMPKRWILEGRSAGCRGTDG
jgi:putative transposase